ncbi:sugar ABC transporter permease [Streptomyces sp. NBC_01092]|nr:sugar ABC transporter permease [Streptomyces sp. NBC_01092]
MAIVTQLPFLATLVISFLDWNALRPDERGFAGFENYTQVLSDPASRSSLLTTVQLTAGVVLLSLVLGLGAALLLIGKFHGRALVRTMFITPLLLVPVASALVWKHALYNPEYGLLNGVMTWFWSLFGSGSPPQLDWITSAPLSSVAVSLIWQWTPFMTLILLAGLQSRPIDAIECARVDGANDWQIFRYLTLPHLQRYLELGILLGSIYIVQNFDAVFTISSGGLGTANLPYTIYQSFYQGHDYGRASAAGILVVIGTIILAALSLRLISTLLREERS